MKPEGALLDDAFRQTLENAATIALALDLQGRVTFANDFLLDLTGRTREEVLGSDWFALFLPDGEADTMRALFHSVIASGEIMAHYENDIVTREGERRTIAFSNIIQLDEQRNPAGTISLGNDVTERRRAEGVLRAREEFFRSLIENLSDVIMILSLDGTITFESPSVERVLGWSPAELAGRDPFSHLHPDDRDLVRETFEAIAAGETRDPIEVRMRHRDGSWRNVEAVGRLLRQESGNVVIVNYRDVTEQKQLREQLVHAQTLEAVGRLAGGIAHDFNNLLTAIVGYSGFLVESFDDDDPRREQALEVVRAAERAAALTAQLLSFSRRQVLQNEMLDLGDVVVSLESMLSQLLGGEATLVLNVEPGCWVRADRGQLGRVVTNLVVNARDAMAGSGRLDVSVSCTDDEVELMVRDSGVGMDPETLSHIFEPFFTTKDVNKGEGLGLATVYGIVTQAGGTVSVVSERGKGACFRVVLPRVAEGTPRVVEEDAPPAQRSGAETILIAEDEEMIRRLVTEVLTRQGYTVIAAATGEEALELLDARDGPVDLLLTDMLMPGMTGTDLYRAASAANPSLRVLFTSGYTHEPLEVFDEWDAAFIGKPFTMNALVAKVRAVLDAKPA